ncbi:MAG: inositol monophosphatase [Planctomycetes bacterium]|nr:inositol monophosphatase [Planctomycetota bacterium]MCW8135756.1 inositol monophosphatase [Planctomycetota bacterium]
MSQVPDVSILTTIAQRVAQVQLRHFERLDQAAIESKGRHRDLLTIADSESERVIIDTVRERYPSHAILAEESGAHLTDSDTWWIIDPVDGTTNFARGFPFFAASVACWHKGQPVLALVEAPRLGERFIAERGSGATVNGRRLRVSDTTEISRSILATGFSYQRNEVQRNNVDNFSRLVLKCHDIRRPGAASLDLAYVAAGRFDGYWEPYLKPWDVAAGCLLVTEAGGRVSDFKGGQDWLFGENAAASNGHIHDELLADLSETEQGYQPWGRQFEQRLRGM